jgi:hypothetical protein
MTLSEITRHIYKHEEVEKAIKLYMFDNKLASLTITNNAGELVVSHGNKGKEFNNFLINEI